MWPAIKAGRRRLLAAGAVAAYAALVAAARSRRPPRLYRLGLVAPFEGLFRNDGYDALTVCRAALTDWNAGARSAGLQLLVWAVDDGNDPTLAARRAAELAGDPLVLAVIGHATPETAAAAAPVYREAGLLQVSPTALAGGAGESDAASALSVSVTPSRVAAALTSTGTPAAEVPPGTGLLDVARRLGSAAPPRSVLLTGGYCSMPLVESFPRVAFSAFVTPSAPGLTELVASATTRALAAITASAAGGGGPLTRQAVLREALATAEREGWVREGTAWYPPDAAAALMRCAVGPDA